jgi:excisionase family DNA binding protein
VFEILIIRDVAARLKLGERTVNAMLSDRELPGFKVRGQWRVRSDHFARWFDLVGSGREPADATAVIMAATETLDAAVHDIPFISPSAAATPVHSTAVSNGGSADVEADPQEVSSMNLLSERVPLADLHQRFSAALGDQVLWRSPINTKPFDLDLKPPLPSRVRVYLFNATRPPGGRPTGEHKVQLIMPGQKRGERGDFDTSDHRTILLVGYAAEEDVFVLWDAGLYRNFAWSRNVQVRAQTLVEASAGRIARQERRLRPGDGEAATETLLACPPSLLGEAIRLRQDLIYARLSEG